MSSPTLFAPERPAASPYPSPIDPSQTLASLQQAIQRLNEITGLMTGQRGSNQFSLVEGLSVLQKQFGNTTARISEKFETIVNGDGGLAQRTSIIEASILAAQGNAASLSARITGVETARIDGDNALAQRATTLEAEVVNARQGAGSISARITQVDQARASGDSALASSLNSLTTTVGANSATLTTVQSSVNGINLRYGVTGYINGQTGGFVFTGLLRNDGAVVYNMEIAANVSIQGNLIVNGTINTPQVSYAAVNQLSYQIKSGISSYLEQGQAWQDILVFTVAGGGDNAYAFVTAALYVAMYIPTNATGRCVMRVLSDTYGNISGDINPVVASVDNVQGTGSYGATNVSFIRPTTVANDVFRLQIQVIGQRYFYVNDPTAMYVEMRKR